MALTLTSWTVQQWHSVKFQASMTHTQKRPTQLIAIWKWTMETHRTKVKVVKYGGQHLLALAALLLLSLLDDGCAIFNYCRPSEVAMPMNSCVRGKTCLITWPLRAWVRARARSRLFVCVVLPRLSTFCLPRRRFFSHSLFQFYAEQLLFSFRLCLQTRF